MRRRGRQANEIEAGIAAWRKDLEWEMNFSQMPYFSRDGVDGDQARRFLEELSEEKLGYRWNFSPTVGCFLRSIAAHPQVRGNGGLLEGDSEEFRPLSGILIEDPELVAMEPDVALGPVPEWIEGVDEHLAYEYRVDREMCVRGSVFRQRWLAARLRYGLDDAESGPDEIDVVGGGRFVHFWWD